MNFFSGWHGGGSRNVAASAVPAPPLDSGTSSPSLSSSSSASIAAAPGQGAVGCVAPAPTSGALHPSLAEARRVVATSGMRAASGQGGHCSPSGSDLSELALRLRRLCEGSDAHALVRPLDGALSLLREFLEAAPANTGTPQYVSVAMDALHKAAAFLEPSAPVDRLMEFALSAHTDQASSQKFLACVGTALKTLREAVAPCDSRRLVDAAILRWDTEQRDFLESCQEVWELHAYFVFLDIKGDRALFDPIIRRLCRLLGCTARTLSACFARTRPWAEATLRALSSRQMGPLLQRLHEDALRRWRADWQERLKKVPAEHRFSEEAQHGNKFWDGYFTHLFKITWPDFVEAFEHFYLLGRCPADILAQLRLRVDPKCSHHVSRATWQRLLRERSRIVDVVDMLFSEVLSDIGARVYREEPLGPGDPRSLVEALASEGEAPHADGSTAELGIAPSSFTSSTVHGGSALSPPPAEPAHQGAVPKPTPWFPFAHSAADDGDMAIPTPHDLRLRQGSACDRVASAVGRQAWESHVAQLCSDHRAPWEPLPEASSERADLRAAALRAVSSCLARTHRALIFRVVSGDLAQGRPLLELPGRRPGEDAPLPALVVTANGTRLSGVTKFGRTSSRKTLLPDCPMSEPIASRSHFNIVYEQETDRYSLMDAASKWGTFVRIDSSVTLGCGDWIRVGCLEFIIRYCGGCLARMLYVPRWSPMFGLNIKCVSPMKHARPRVPNMHGSARACVPTIPAGSDNQCDNLVSMCLAGICIRVYMYTYMCMSVAIFA